MKHEVVESTLEYSLAGVIFYMSTVIATLDTITVMLGLVMVLTVIIKNVMYICKTYTNHRFCAGRKVKKEK